MSSNYHKERCFSEQERNYNNKNQFNMIKRERFHCYPHQKDSYKNKIIIKKEQNRNLFNNNGLEIRKINDILIKGGIYRSKDLIEDFEPQKNNDNKNYIYNNSKENNTNYVIEDIKTNNCCVKKKFDFKKTNCLYRVNSDITRKYKDELFTPSYEYKKNIDLNSKEINNSINNNRIDINENNDEYRKRLEKYNLKIKFQDFNDLNEEKQTKKFAKRNDNCYSENYILKYKNNNYSSVKEQNKNYNFNKIETNKYDIEYIEYITGKGIKDVRNNQINEEVKSIVRSKSNHSFKYINQQSNGKKVNNKTDYIKKEYNNSITNNQKEYKYNNEEERITRINYNKDNQTRYKLSEVKDNNVNKNYETLIINETSKNDDNNRSNFSNIKKIQNYEKLIEFKTINNDFIISSNNISFKEVKQEKNRLFLNKIGKNNSVKNKLIGMENNSIETLKITNNYQINRYNNIKSFNKNVSYDGYDFYKKEKQIEKEKLLNKYLKKDFNRPYSEEKKQQKINNNYNLDINKMENVYNYNKNNQIEKNIIKSNEKENKCDYFSNYTIKEQYSADTINETPIVNKSKNENIFSDRIKYRHVNDNKNIIQKRYLNHDLYNDKKKEQNNFDEIKNKSNKKNNSSDKKNKVLNFKNTSNIGKTKIKNNNSSDNYTDKIKNSNITQKVIEKTSRKKGKNHVLINNFVKEIKNIKKNNTNNKMNNNFIIKNRNNYQLNSLKPIINENFIPNNNNNQINFERKAVSPSQIQNIKIKNKIFNKNTINSISKKINQNICNDNSINVNNLNHFKKQFNNNTNSNNKKSNKKISNNNKELNNSNCHVNNNFTNPNIHIKNNIMNNKEFSNNNSYKNNIKNDGLENINLCSQKKQEKKNNNENSKNLNQKDSSENVTLTKILSSPNISARKEILIKKKCANGLQNIGANCFMNATLQCLAHVEYLTKHILQRKYEINSKKTSNKLVKSYLEVLENIWENTSIKDYVPNNFKEIINEMNPLFKGKQYIYSKDFILFLLENIHNELNKIKEVKQINTANVDPYNFYNSLNNFTRYFKNNFKSIISDIFYGIYNTQMKCLDCNTVTHNIQYYNILIIPLEEVRLFKKRLQNIVTLQECFEFNQKSEYINGESKIYCNKCQEKTNCVKNKTLIVGPKVLIINLNRGKGIKFEVKLNFEEFIDINQFIYFKNTSCRYQLIGVVTQFGPSGIYEHFIAFCKSFIDGNWYRYNDSIVTSSNFQEAKTTGVPYILFYSAIN